MCRDDDDDDDDDECGRDIGRGIRCKSVVEMPVANTSLLLQPTLGSIAKRSWH